MNELYEELFKLKLVASKYDTLIKLIKEEAKGIYFDRDRILKIIAILDENEQKEKETNE